MSPKKILVVSSGFYPQISPRSFRTTELVKEFARQGHLVKVITHRKKVVHDEFEKQFGVEMADLGELKFAEIKTSQNHKVVSMFTRIIRRSMQQLLEYPDIELMFQVKRALKSEKDHDLLVSIAVPYPIHWGVASAITPKRKPAKVWIGDCGDPYMGDQADSFKKFFYFKYVEKWFFKKADFISVPTLGSIKAYYPEFHKKIKVIPQGFNFQEPAIPATEPKNDITTFAYAGGFIPGIRDPKNLFEFLCSYKRPFKFVVYTNNRDMVLPYVAASNNRIELRPYIPRDQLLVKLSEMDFLVNINNGTNVQTPSKLIGYALTKRPILSLDSALTDTKIITEFLQADYSNQLVIEDLQKYDIKNVAGQFLELTSNL